MKCFHRFIRDIHHHNDITVFVMVTMVIEVLMLLHLGIAVILLMNPVFLHVEEVLGAPRGECMQGCKIPVPLGTFCTGKQSTPREGVPKRKINR